MGVCCPWLETNRSWLVVSSASPPWLLCRSESVMPVTSEGVAPVAMTAISTVLGGTLHEAYRRERAPSTAIALTPRPPAHFVSSAATSKLEAYALVERL